MGRVQQKRSWLQIRSQCPKTEEGFTETMGIMLGSLMVERKEGQFRPGICQQIEIVTEIPAVTGGIPANRAIRLREVAVAITVEDA